MKKMVLVSENGVVAQKGMDANDVMSVLLYAFLKVWDHDKFTIDIDEASKAVIEAVISCGTEPEEPEEDDIVSMLAELLGLTEKEDDEDEH